MTAEGPEDRAGAEELGAPNAGAPFDLGDSRDLAAAVRAAWDADQNGAAARPSVPRPPLDKRTGATGAPQAPAREVDPLAHLRHGTPRRFSLPTLGSFRFPTGRPAPKTLAAVGVAVAALAAAAAFPVVSDSTEPSPVVAEPRRPVTTTSLRAAPTTAFTYPPETIVPPDTTAVPAAPAAASEADSSTAVSSAPAPTATTSRPRSTPTTRATSRTTSEPAPTTTQPPPPPPDDSGGSDESGEPPPYP